MNEGVSVGAVGAAIIAAIISLLGLIISKEQKTSEFRQAWINDVRTCFIAYLANINAISDVLRVPTSDNEQKNRNLQEKYKALNEASNGILLRLNDKESFAQEILCKMKEFEKLAECNRSLTPDAIRKVEAGFVVASKALLKSEWDRVKRGEVFFRFTKWGSLVLALIFSVVLAYQIIWQEPQGVQLTPPPTLHLLNG